MNQRIIFLTFVILSFNLVKNQENPDVVKDLPGYPYKGRMFSGYLSIDDPLKRYHYILVEAARETDTVPLILWLNGGPGCSSMDGFVNEIGPATFPQHELEFKINEYSWHKLANMMFLESPAGVGFSRIDSQLEEELYVDDDITAEENFEAMLDFFKKYPRFRSHDFYISGESYAGIYIPLLAKKILDYNKKVATSEQIRLKGLLIGNGCTSNDFDYDNSLFDFAFTHHIVSYETRLDYNKYCKDEFDKDKCEEIKNIINQNLDGLNPYDLYAECWYPDVSTMTEEELNKSYYYNYARWAFRKLKNKKPTKSLNKKRHFLSFLEEEKPVKSNTPSNEDTPCMDDRASRQFFNKPEVQRALHVDQMFWDICDTPVCQRYVKLDKASLYLYPELTSSGLKIWFFSGDADMAVPYNGSQKWIDTLNLEIISPWRSWHHPDDDLNVAGYRQIYKGLTFITFKGAGHMVVEWRARDAFYMLNQFIQGKDL